MVVDVLAIVLIAVLLVCSLAPLPFPVFHAASKFTDVNRCVFPFVLAEPMRLAITVLSLIDVSVSKSVGALAMLETKLPLALVPISIFPLVHSVPIRLAFTPAAHVRVSKDASPDALALLEPIFPLALVDFAINPSVDALTVRLVIFEVSFILVAVRVALHASAIPIVVLPTPFVKPCRSVNTNTKPRPFAFQQLTLVDTVLKLLDPERSTRFNLFIIEEQRLHAVVVMNIICFPSSGIDLQLSEDFLSSLLILSQGLHRFGVH